MCNSLHKDSTPISKTGFGYKVFQKLNNEYYSMVWNTLFNKHNIWNEKINADGFCFCLTKIEGERLLKKWKGLQRYQKCENYVLKKIKYKQGLGKHIENGIMEYTSFETALCKEFEIIDY